MRFAERRKLLKMAATIPLATFLSPVKASTKCAFDDFILEIANSEKLFLEIAKKLQDVSTTQSRTELRQQLMFDTGCVESTDKATVQKTILATVKEDFINDRIVNYEGWILSQTELNIYQLIYLT